VARRLLLLVAAVAALSGSAPAIAAVSDEQSLLVIRATWGPKPFATDDVNEVLGKVDAFFRASSFGRMSFKTTLTPWVRAYPDAPACNPLTIAYPADDAARAAGYDPSAYDRIVYLFPTNDCAWAGSRWGKRALLNGTLTVANTAHELGHTFGLPHAQAWSCAPRPCGVVNYGDPYDTMGSGTGDFDSYEKWLLGWITRVTRPSKPAVYTIAPIETPSTQAQGLVVTTTRNRYWFEVRRDPARDATGTVLMHGGLLVHAGPSPTIAPGMSSYGGLSNALILDPVGRGRPWLQPGDRFGEPGAFRIVVLRKAGSSYRLRFAWTDTKAPKRPAIVFPGAHVRRWANTAVTWQDSTEQGSGIAEYRMSIDGAPAVSITQSIYPELNAARIADLRRGAHTITIVAIDRAGNRSLPAIRRFVVGSS
jgi:Gametolysin peptidase M11